MPRTGAKHDTGKSVLKGMPRAALLPLAPPAFQERFLADILPDDLATLTPAERQRLTASVWQLMQRRRRGDVNMRLYNPVKDKNGWTVDHTVLEIVSDDMPFLVDSVTGELHRRGLSVHLFIHPVVNVTRDAQGQLVEILKAGSPLPDRAESLMHVQFDQCVDPKLLDDIGETLRDIFEELYAAVRDWPTMRQRMGDAAAEIMEASEKRIPADEKNEARSFLAWLDDNNFTYLGYRHLDIVKRGANIGWKVTAGCGLGILRDDEVRMFGGLRDLDKQPREVQEFIQKQGLIIVTKTNERARIHRTVPMDAIFVQRFDGNGAVIAEHLFVGLFTSRSYSQSPSEVPFVRHKIQQVIDRATFDPYGHDGKALVHILKHYPRDELFQISTDDLFHHSVGIVRLQERSRIALFIRRDPFRRFVTCLVYTPREHYDSALRLRLQRKLSTAFGGPITDYNVRIDDSPLARVFLTLSIPENADMPDVSAIEGEVRELSRSWPDRLRDSLVAQHGEAEALNMLRRYAEAFPPAYCNVMTPDDAVNDIRDLERVQAQNHCLVDFTATELAGLVHLRLFQPVQPLVLSEVLPLIENMGLKVEYMGGPHEIAPQGGKGKYYIHEFACRLAQPAIGESAHIKPLFEEAFSGVWSGKIENDGLNALTLRASLPWREILMLRALLRYLRQLRVPYSLDMMTTTLLDYPEITQQLAALFVARFDPAFRGDRAKAMAMLVERIMTGLAQVQLVEQDQILRRFLNLIQSALRTNYFQTDDAGEPKPYLSIKFNSRAIDYMPLPKPLMEIFVYSPRVEAVHLRGGKVARGGIRWSDRREDFRNEILGLMKAQMVKNCVIVPVGSKGGFIVKRPPAEADKFQAEGIECYRLMMRGLLDVTDNRVGDKIVPPRNVVRHDGDDPYLVVAADKGTAKFSDIANAISQEYHFWLDDAFASGGSAGYDHKQMGITARGAWEAVKRMFRERGTDIQSTDFTVVGVGDMSGDVFGNGMLLSRHIRMIGAFDHRHIFCDPNPDAAISFAERERMFNLPRSSWADYDREKISKGGGVFARSDKSVKLTPEMRKAFGLAGESVTPNELIQAMLKAKVDLLYFGGIGTYVKASGETHENVGDRANDALRIDGNDIGALVVGEGANLGLTQRARIEYAIKGGRINTDAIDNSAGVDTSDHEVNIKILFRKAVLGGKLSLAARDKLLASMTDEVARLVLRDNYLQTQALSLAESQAPELLPLHARSIRFLEKTGLLNRAVEFLPDEAEIAERQERGKGLTRPELAVFLAYAKIWLYDELLASDLPDDAFTKKDLRYYFPEPLHDKYRDAIEHHQLRREITATVLTNSLINRIGGHFPFIVAERTGRSAAEVARAYLLVRASYNMHKLRAQIEKLDNIVPAATQTELLLALNKVTNYVVPWFLTQTKLPAALTPAIEYYRDKVAQLATWLMSSPPEIDGADRQREEDWLEKGVPASLARHIAIMPYLATAPDIAQLAEKAGCSVSLAAATFFGLGHRLGLDWLRKKTEGFTTDTPWQRDAVAALLDDLYANQRSLAVVVLGKIKGKATSANASKALIETWLTKNKDRLEAYDALLDDFRAVPALDIAMLTLASRQLGAFLR